MRILFLVADTIDQDEDSGIQETIDELTAVIATELGAADPKLKVSMESLEPSASMRKLVHLSTEKVLDLLMALPHGVQAMSPDVPGLVETSCNLGTLKTDDLSMNAVILSRSAVTSKVEYLGDTIDALVKLAGGTTERPLGYPGWKPDPQSVLLAEAREVFTSIFGHEPKVKAIHAGLECGIIGEKYPGIDMLSVGPDIRGAHTVGEYVSISSVEKFWTFLLAFLEKK